VYYAGVGSRDTPVSVCALMEAAARALAWKGWILRSGHAEGADQAFERGAAGRAEIFLPWPTFEHETPVQGRRMEYPDTLAYEIAAETHPNWYTLGGGGRALHARNVHQVLGRTCTDPVRFVLCWTEEAKRRGGTATTIRLAETRKIDVLNLWHTPVKERVERMVEEHLAEAA
jgi:uncharacterized protein YbjT (DUF2867 family)